MSKTSNKYTVSVKSLASRVVGCCRWKVIVGLLGTLVVMLLLAACCYYCCGGAYGSYGSTRGSFFTIRRRVHAGNVAQSSPSGAAFTQVTSLSRDAADACLQ